MKVYVNIRMPIELREHLAKLANDNCRSMSSQIVWMLSQNCEEPAQPERTVRTKSVERPEGISEQTWDDFKRLRAAKKAPVTQRALDGIYKEAMKAGVTMEAALQECCARGWTGFKAEWMMSEKDKINALLAPSSFPPVDELLSLSVRK